MRKILFVLGFTALTGSAFSQATFGIHANGILASGKEEYTEDNQTETIKFDGRFSWKFGAVATIPISESFSFMPQLNLLNKGGKFETSESESFPGYDIQVKGESTLKLTYLELPLNVVYNHTSGFFIGAGPSLSYGLKGENKYDLQTTINGEVQPDYSESGTSKIKFDGDENADDDYEHAKAFEFGASIIAGYKLSNGVFINAHYNLGLSNISPYENSTSKNKYFGIGIGYFFGGAGYARK